MIFFAQQYTHQAPHQIYFTEYKESGLECKWAKAKMCGVFFPSRDRNIVFVVVIIIIRNNDNNIVLRQMGSILL